MFKYILPLFSLVIGGLIGSILTVNASLGIAKYLSIAILAALDSVLGGARSLLENTYDGLIMLTGFFTNALLAMALAFLGNQICIDMFTAATICFALRIFSNLAFIRRDIITKYREKNAQAAQNAQKSQNTQKVKMPKIKFSPNPKAKSAASKTEPEPNLENTITGLLLDTIPLDNSTKADVLTDEEIDNTPLKVKAIVSSQAAEKAEKTEKSE
jgi:small basic protein